MRDLQRSSRARARFALGFLILSAFLAAPSSAFAGLLSPESGPTPNAEGIHSLYNIIGVLALIVFFGVGGLLLYTLVKFRSRKGAVAAQIHGNNRLEIGWTVGAALLLVLISIVTFIKLPQIKNPPNSGPAGVPVTKNGSFVAAGASEELPPNGRSLGIKVNGQQYVWRYTYNDGDNNNLNNVFAYEQMVVPTNTTVTLTINSQDVQHSWWIPALGGKFDAVPGYTNFTWFKISKPGLYTGQCAELCGRNHANMTAQVLAVPPAQFEAWYAKQKRNIANADKLAAAERNAIDQRQKQLLKRGVVQDKVQNAAQ